MINSARDDATDNTLDMAVNTACNGAADVETKGDWDEWGMAVGTKNLVSLG